ncbi:MAG: substrate-binding domain-containing protein [Acidothermus cellulolyticus]|nr:substrate-binding domain-containing protein [Acidothermus cellulolyticus]
MPEIPAVGGIAVVDGKLLLVRRGRPPSAGSWSVPGGRVEPGEDDQAALVREFREETGLLVSVKELLGEVRRPGPAGTTYRIRDYRVELVTPAAAVAGDDAADVAWVPLDAVARYPLSPGLLRALQRWGIVPQAGYRHPSHGSPTLEEVAAHAGVSRATVSRVVNDSPRVSPAVREAVLRSIEELGYVPNRAARTLVTRRTDTIALVISEPESRLFSDPVLAGFVRGIADVLAGTDYMFVLLTAQPDTERIARYIRNGHADGVILMSLHGDDPLVGMLEARRMPAVLSGRPLGRGHTIPYVDADNVGGARQATEYLVRQGRRTIVSITGPMEMCAAIDRLAGFRSGLPPELRRRWRSLIATGAFTEESGERAMAELLERVPDLDAVFAANDLMAAGALRVLKAAGRRVPDDVALVGFDDSSAARHTDPQLTSVRQSAEELGQNMAKLLLVQLADPDARPDPVILPTELVIRESA